MYYCFVRMADNLSVPVQSFSDLREVWNMPGSQIWVDFEAPTAEELDNLDSIIDVDDAALEDCRAGDQDPRIVEYEDYLFAVMFGAFSSGVSESDLFEPQKLAVFCGARYLITIHREPLRVITMLRERSQKHADQVLKHGVDALFCNITGLMFENFVRLAERYREKVEELEEACLDPKCRPEILHDVAALRTNLLAIRRVAGAQRDLLDPLASGEYDYVSESLGPQFSREREHLSSCVERIDIMRERLRGVVENYRAWLATQTNEIMRTLTVISSIMLPLSLLAGIFGMNVKLGPLGDRPWGILVIVAAMLTLAGGMLYAFRRRGWL